MRGLSRTQARKWVWPSTTRGKKTVAKSVKSSLRDGTKAKPLLVSYFQFLHCKDISGTEKSPLCILVFWVIIILIQNSSIWWPSCVSRWSEQDQIRIWGNLSFRLPSWRLRWNRGCSKRQWWHYYQLREFWWSHCSPFRYNWWQQQNGQVPPLQRRWYQRARCSRIF